MKSRYAILTLVCAWNRAIEFLHNLLMRRKPSFNKCLNIVAYILFGSFLIVFHYRLLNWFPLHSEIQ